MPRDVDAIYQQGVFRPLEPLVLPDGTRVHLRIEEDQAVTSRAVRTGPRLAHPEQAVDFEMNVGEAPNAGL